MKGKKNHSSTSNESAPDRKGFEDKSAILFLFFNANICCDSLLEVPQQEGPNERSQTMFLWKNMENHSKIISVTPYFQKRCKDICTVFIWL